ncbi:probable splicing factor, arginine/serine-rich 7 [Planococcus citri]|uniref:probable splicing factor, arginine/serine-rich 7 n=1 Tax=Planococcus citri TaxID=170843 RepID=UPI0031F99D11
MTGQIEEIVAVSVGTKVIQVTNIAPQATRDQMHALFGYIGKIEDIRLYPTVRDVSLPVQSRICYVKYFDAACVGVAQHLTNTVFIDRALIVTPYQTKGGEIPDEYRALDIAAQANVIPGLYPSEPKLPSHVVNHIIGEPPNQQIITQDPVLTSNGLPPYPPLSANHEARRIEEIRRTLVVINVDESVNGEQMVDFFQRAGDVKYVRFCTRENDSNRYALIEFSEQSSIIPALKMNGSELCGRKIQVYHSTQSIAKPMAKSNEAAQREIEEAMTRVKEAQSMISAAIDPVIGILSKDKKRSRSNSRSRRRSRSRSRRRSRSRSSKYRHRSRSRSHRSKRRSRSPHSRTRRSRSRGRRRSGSRERDRDRDRDRDRTRRHYRSRSRRSKERKRSRSRGHSKPHKRRSKDRERNRSASRHKKSRSKSRSRKRSRSRSNRSSRSKSRRPTKEDDQTNNDKK